MARRTVLALVVGVLVLGLAAVLGAGLLRHHDAGPPASGRQPGAGNSPVTSDAASTSPSRAAGSRTRDGGSGGGAGGPRSRSGSEQPTAAASATSRALPGLKPARPTPTLHRVRRPASASGRLVRAFPSTSVPVPTGARIRFSSISSSDGRVHADLVARTALSADEVFAFYRSRLGPRGLLGAPVRAVAGSRAQAYSDGRTSVTVTRAATGTISVTAVLCCVAPHSSR